jgi:hypothetical protein
MKSIIRVDDLRGWGVQKRLWGKSEVDFLAIASRSKNAAKEIY